MIGFLAFSKSQMDLYIHCHNLNPKDCFYISCLSSILGRENFEIYILPGAYIQPYYNEIMQKIELMNEKTIPIEYEYF